MRFLEKVFGSESRTWRVVLLFSPSFLLSLRAIAYMSSSNAPSTSVLDTPASKTPDMSPNPETLNLDPQMAQGEAEFETIADRLMEELFADVERMLERGVDLSDPQGQKPMPEAIAQSFDLQPFDLQSSGRTSVDSSSLVLASKLTPRPSILAQAESEEELADLEKLMAEIQESPTPEKLTKTLNKLTVALIVTAIAAGGAAWYFRDRLPMLTAFVKSATNPAPVAVAPPSPVDLQQKQNEDFLAYVGRSLDRIERDAKQQRSRTAIANTAPSPAVVTAPGLERIYIPIPQSPQATSPSAPAIVTQPFAQPAFPQATFSQPAPQQPAAPPTATAPATTPNITAVNSHVLIGILELGDRSAALVETNGTPQRVQIGEAIGSSGWTLVSVKNQEAIVRRNGEVRSIYVGQQF